LRRLLLLLVGVSAWRGGEVVVRGLLLLKAFLVLCVLVMYLSRQEDE